MTRFDKRYKSGKAESLIKLRGDNFQVPAFFVCDHKWSESDILKKVNEILPRSRYFAIRSSADNEDSKEKSFAGHFYSAIGVSKDKIFEEFLKVNASFGENQGKVIVQEFINSDSSGVLFAMEDRIIINSNFGLCRTVVNGHGCDEYICDLNGLIISKKILKTKKSEVLINGEVVIKSHRDKESLSADQLKKLAEVSGAIRRFFGCDQDIEWCFLENKLFVLQSRPITKKIPLSNLNHFDSANIAESYSGIVLPLTCSFAKMVYERVYKDFLIMSGISRSKIERHSKIFENLLGFFSGRMYYNMNNWYLLAAFAPGYDINKKNFELMISSNIKNKDIITDIKPPLLFYFIYPLILTIKLLLFRVTAEYFKFFISREIKRFRNIDFEILNKSDCITLFDRLNKKMLRRWYITLENDFLVMTYLGLLTKLVGKDKIKDVLVFKSKSTEQIKNLCLLSSSMKKNELLWQAVLNNDQERFDRELSKDQYLKVLLRDYLFNFGGRFANELKLESVGIDEDFGRFFSVLKLYSNYNLEQRKEPVAKKIELPFLKSIAYYFLIRRFRKQASLREDFRLLRSNVFALDRKLFRRIGQIFEDKKLIEKADDIFYLQVDEIIKPPTGADIRLSQIVAERKKQYLEYKNVSLPSHFSTYDNLPPTVESGSVDNKKIIQATPVSSGQIKGRVKVFREFYMPDKIDFDIIVTSHTDPGWTSLIALAKGMIIEHGGVLSHASIVARELGIPTVIGAENILNVLKDYQTIELDGSSGLIKILK